jgi:hypothetical protein
MILKNETGRYYGGLWNDGVNIGGHNTYNKMLDKKYTELRQIIREEIHTLILERYINLSKKEDIEPYLKDIWDIMQFSYKEIGGFKTASTPQELLDKINFAKLVRKNGKIVAATLYKDKYGRKAIGGGYDGSNIGKESLINIFREDATMKRSWGEFSGAPAHLMIRYGGIPVPNDMAEEILGVPILSKDPDGYYYEREINGEVFRKIIIGNIQK